MSAPLLHEDCCRCRAARNEGDGVDGILLPSNSEPLFLDTPLCRSCHQRTITEIMDALDVYDRLLAFQVSPEIARRITRKRIEKKFSRAALEQHVA